MTAFHVDSISDVNKVLAELRRRRGANEGASVASARAATMNFVVFVDDPQHRPWVVERALRVVEKHPSRLILLDSTDATSGVDVAAEGREERVDVGVGRLDHGAIASITQELSVPEIPTVLWWSGSRLLVSRTFAGLVAQSVSVVVDSSGKTKDEETIRELTQFVQRYPSTGLRDLAFMRLLPWQDTIAQFFDDPDLREDLFSIEQLHIESGSEAEAIYLGGWLASRLSWNVSGPSQFRTHDGRTIEFRKITKGDQRRVQRVELCTADTTYSASLSPEDAGVVVLEVTGAKARPERLTPIQAVDNTSLIERAILENGHDRIFETSLQTVRDLLG